MDLDLTFSQGDGYLLSRVKGTWTAEGVAKAALAVAEEARRRGSTRVIIDVTLISAPESDFHRYIAGEVLARAFYEIRLAIVGQGDLINSFAEETAFAQGADVRVVPDYDAAMRWLSAPEADTSAGAARS